MRLLARREHSRVELARKLAPHAESVEQLEMLLNALQNEKLLSDARYAAQRVAVRGARYGNARLQYELRHSGVSDEAVTVALAAGEDERARCRTVWQKKFGVLPADAEGRVKQIRFLQTRGFSMEIIRHLLAGEEE
ncbi:MAG TPA: recombination regulator RecX [Rhodocyclaceae bacterium]|nr:recombination regulator RecX [Rhodocyclaceae bacterium]